MATITIDPNYGYVILAATSTLFLNLAHSINTGAYRKAAKVPYPAAYAPDSRTDMEAHQFNCAQRAHSQYSENHPTALAAMLIAGLQFPLTSAVMGAGWAVSRFIYMRGYSEGQEGGKGRYKGTAYAAFQLGLMGLAGWVGGSMVMEGFN